MIFGMNDSRMDHITFFPALFCPSSEFFDLPTEPRFQMLRSIFEHKIYPSMELRNFRFDFEERFHREINDLDFMIVIGLYMDHSILRIPLPKSVGEFEIAKTRFLKWRDKRKSRALQSFLFENLGGNTREFFDNGSHEFSRTPISQKRQNLQFYLQGSEYRPSDLLSYHFYLYSSMKNYQHVTDEAPYSAWDLCFLQNQFIAE